MYENTSSDEFRENNLYSYILFILAALAIGVALTLLLIVCFDPSKIFFSILPPISGNSLSGVMIALLLDTFLITNILFIITHNTLFIVMEKGLEYGLDALYKSTLIVSVSYVLSMIFTISEPLSALTIRIVFLVLSLLIIRKINILETINYIYLISLLVIFTILYYILYPIQNIDNIYIYILCDSIAVASMILLTISSLLYIIFYPSREYSGVALAIIVIITYVFYIDINIHYAIMRYFNAGLSDILIPSIIALIVAIYYILKIHGRILIEKIPIITKHYIEKITRYITIVTILLIPSLIYINPILYIYLYIIVCLSTILRINYSYNILNELNDWKTLVDIIKQLPRETRPAFYRFIEKITVNNNINYLVELFGKSRSLDKDTLLNDMINRLTDKVSEALQEKYDSSFNIEDYKAYIILKDYILENIDYEDEHIDELLKAIAYKNYLSSTITYLLETKNVTCEVFREKIVDIGKKIRELEELTKIVDNDEKLNEYIEEFKEGLAKIRAKYLNTCIE